MNPILPTRNISLATAIWRRWRVVMRMCNVMFEPSCQNLWTFIMAQDISDEEYLVLE